jgi:hypothetical protein
MTMSDPELFKYDVRVRERMLRKGLIQQGEIDQRLQALPDSEGQLVELELKQPALFRHEPEPPTPAPRAPAHAPAALPQTSAEPRRFQPIFGNGVDRSAEAPRNFDASSQRADENSSLADELDDDDDIDDDIDDDDDEDVPEAAENVSPASPGEANSERQASEGSDAGAPDPEEDGGDEP